MIFSKFSNTFGKLNWTIDVDFYKWTRLRSPALNEQDIMSMVKNEIISGFGVLKKTNKDDVPSNMSNMF